MIIPLFWKSVNFACMWIVLRICYVIDILFNFLMILHIIIIREENMVVEICHVTKLPLVMLRLLSSLSSSLHMLVLAWLANLFAYNMPMHRKYVRLRCVCHVFHDAPFVLQFLSFMWASLKSQCLARGVSTCWEATQFYFCSLIFAPV